MRIAFALLAFAPFAACQRNEAAAPSCTAEEAGALYQRKIEPVLTDDHPKSCNQCHLSGIDLSLFVRDTPCRTMACLQELQLVDFEQPEQSKVLTWIARAKPGSTLITEAVIRQEYDGFLDWIRYSASCGEKVCETYVDPCGNDQPDASVKCEVTVPVAGQFSDPGDCSELTLEQLFTADVYEWRDRCYPCHFTSDQEVDAPKWITDVNKVNQDPALACTSASLETMRTVLSWGLVDLTLPSNSLLLLKPLSVEQGGVYHGGGHKFDGATDPTYQAFYQWITRYAACSADNSGLELAGPAPSVQDDSDAGSGSPIYDLCNCIIMRCHDEAHAKWGPSDEAVIAGCRAEAVALPRGDANARAGNFFECRATYCAEANVDRSVCSAALGETVCL